MATDKHNELKLAAMRWLKILGLHPDDREYQLLRYRVDVIGRNSSGVPVVAVECGVTPSYKLDELSLYFPHRYSVL